MEILIQQMDLSSRYVGNEMENNFYVETQETTISIFL